jgi:hypothetical protein
VYLSCIFIVFCSCFHITQEAEGGDYVNVAMRIWNSAENKTSEELIYNNVRERQVITFRTTVRREVQQIVIANAISGSFRIIGPDGYTDVSVTGSSTSDISKGIREKANKRCPWNLGVSRRLVNGTLTLNITFDCASFSTSPLFTLSNVDLVANGTLGLQVTRLSTASAPLSGPFKLGFDNNWTPLMNLTAGLTVFQAELQRLSNVGRVTVFVNLNFLDEARITVEFFDQRV